MNRRGFIAGLTAACATLLGRKLPAAPVATPVAIIRCGRQPSKSSTTMLELYNRGVISKPTMMEFFAYCECGYAITDTVGLGESWTPQTSDK